MFSVQPSSAGGLRDDVADHVTGEIVGGGGGISSEAIGHSPHNTFRPERQ